MIYVGFATRAGRYSPTWASAEDKQSWLAAARIVLAAVDEGFL